MKFSLHNISKKITSDSFENIKVFIQEVNNVLEGGYCLYYRKDPGNSLLFRGTKDNNRKEVFGEEIGDTYFIDNVINEGGIPLIVNDISSVLNTDNQSFIAEYNIGSFIAINVLLADEIIGYLLFINNSKRYFSQKEVNLLSEFASLIMLEERHIVSCKKYKLTNKKYNTIFENSVDSIILLKDDIITEVNSTLYGLFGYEDDELIGKSIQSLFIVSKDGRESKALQDFSNKSIGYSNQEEIRFVRKDNSEFVGELYLTKIDAIDYNTLAIIRNISKRKEYELGLIKAKEEASNANQMKSLSLASMSHEIRTPLNSIIGFSDLLLDEETTEDEKEMFSKLIQTAGKSLMQLVGDIIDISKIEAGQVTIKKMLFNVNNFLQEVLLTFRQEKENQDKSNIELKLVLSDKASELEIETDPHRLQQVFNNLLTNSLKFIDEGFIEFGYLSITPNYIQFYVKDTGVGIDIAKREKIFEQFGQDKTTYSRNHEGTGLGLSISKSFVELLGGKIWLDSEIDAGSTFYFTIPLGLKTLEKDKTKKSFGRPYIDWSRYTIVIADDVKENYVFLKGVFGSTGINIIWAKNGQEAVDLCKNNEIDVVLMDIRMPIMDGLKASELIKAYNPNIHIIAQTAFASPEDKANCFKSGCDEYFKKPINHERLFDVISKYLE